MIGGRDFTGPTKGGNGNRKIFQRSKGVGIDGGFSVPLKSYFVGWVT